MLLSHVPPAKPEACKTVGHQKKVASIKTCSLDPIHFDENPVPSA